MSTEVVQEQSHEPRPTGIIQPQHAYAILAVKAIDKRRPRDAGKHIDAIPDSVSIDRMWKQFLHGLLAVERGDLGAAEPLLLQVASEGSGEDESPPRHAEPTVLRLAARALEKVGWIYRRQDRPDDAYRTHRSAYDIRSKHGSFEEMWETATSLGIDADLARRYADGQAWHRIAAEAGEQAAEESERIQAVAWTNLAASLAKSDLYDQAVDAARTARLWWHKHDIGAVTAAQADMNLGSMLLKLGESLHGDDPERGKGVLDEAVEWLTSSGEALSAFGSDNAADTRWCDEQADFARRLRDTLDAPDNTSHAL